MIAAAAYTALTIAFTWPLARGLTRDIPGDFGDPLLNAWILAWDTSHLGRGWWNANIYYPHPLALAYSEHLLPQALAIWPIQAIANNPILSYNVAFLATFVLSGLGMYLFVREITNSRAAAFVAGVVFAFAPTASPRSRICRCCRHSGCRSRCTGSGGSLVPGRPALAGKEVRLKADAPSGWRPALPHGSFRACPAAITCCSSAR